MPGPTPTLLEFAQVQGRIYDGALAGPTFEDPGRLTHVYMTLLSSGMPCVNFEGTLDWQEWVNRDLVPLGWSSFSHPKLGLLHAMLSFGVQGVLPLVQRYLATLGWPPFAVAGHSKGAGEAILAAAFLKEGGRPPALVRALEPPRVGTSTLARWLAEMDLVVTQTYNCHGVDLVTEVPSVPPWEHPRAPVRIKVGDGLSLVEKHKIPAIVAGLQEQPAALAGV